MDIGTTKWISYFKGIAILGVIMVHFGVKGIDSKIFSMLIYHTAKGTYIFIFPFLPSVTTDGTRLKIIFSKINPDVPIKQKTQSNITKIIFFIIEYF